MRLLFQVMFNKIEPSHDKTNRMACAPSKDSDQPWHPPSLIRVFAVRMKKAWVLSYPLSAQQRLWSDWADPRLIWVFTGRTVILLVLAWGGSIINQVVHDWYKLSFDKTFCLNKQTQTSACNCNNYLWQNCKKNTQNSLKTDLVRIYLLGGIMAAQRGI